MKKLKLYFLTGFVGVGLLLQSWPTHADNLQAAQTKPAATGNTQKKPIRKKPLHSDVQKDLNPEQTKTALRTWVALCAPCHTVLGTGTDMGPPLFGAKARKRFTVVELKKIFAAPENHGLSEAIPAFRKLNPKQREELAIWFATIKNPEDIVVTADIANPPPFIYVQQCAGCHAPDGTGNIGPNLYDVSKRRDREQILKLIDDPSSVGVESNIMPTFSELSQAERNEIVDWLMKLTK